MRSELDLLRARLKDSEALKEQYHTALIAAENRVERARSSTVTEMEKRIAVNRDGSEEPQRKPSSPAVSGSVHWWEFRPSNLTHYPDLYTAHIALSGASRWGEWILRCRDSTRMCHPSRG